MGEHTDMIELGRKLAAVYSFEDEIDALRKVITGYKRDLLRYDLEYRAAVAERERYPIWNVTKRFEADRKATRAHEVCASFVQKIQEASARIESLKLLAEETVRT